MLGSRAILRVAGPAARRVCRLRTGPSPDSATHLAPPRLSATPRTPQTQKPLPSPPAQVRWYQSRSNFEPPDDADESSPVAWQKGQEDEPEALWNVKKMKRFPRDEELLELAEMVIIRDGNVLSAPMALDDLLLQTDLKKDMIECLALPGKSQPELQHPICRIVDRAEHRRQQLEQEKKDRRTKVLTKEMEINWAITKHDLGYKMKQLQKFLGRGCQCEVTLCSQTRKHKKKASMDECEEVYKLVRQAIGEVPGKLVEYKKVEGQIGTRLTMFVMVTGSGSSSSGSKSASTPDAPS